MGEKQEVASLVDRFDQGPPLEQLIPRPASRVSGVEPVQGDQGTALCGIRLAEDEIQSRHEKIPLEDEKRQTAAFSPSRETAEDMGGMVLATSEVEILLAKLELRAFLDRQQTSADPPQAGDEKGEVLVGHAR